MENSSTPSGQALTPSWNTVYPRYFDAKVSITDGRRVPRKSSLWWPQATHIAQACASLGLPSVLEPEKTHPTDWENPGRVKVQIVRDGKPINPIVKNRECREGGASSGGRRKEGSMGSCPTLRAAQL